MANYTVSLTDEETAALETVAAADGKTPQDVIDEQVGYYLGCVLRDYIESPGSLSVEERRELDARLVLAKNDYLKQAKSAAGK